MRQVDPSAQRTLNQMVAAHQALAAFSCKVRVDAVSEKRRETTTASVAYQKPNRIRVEVQRSGKPALLYLSDGVTRLSAGRATKLEGGEKGLISALSEASFLIAPAFLYLVSRSAPVSMLLPGSLKLLTFGTALELDEVAVVVVAAEIVTRSGSAHLTVAMGKEDHLLRKLSVETAFENENLSLMELYSSVKANPVLEKSVFVLPKATR